MLQLPFSGAARAVVYERHRPVNRRVLMRSVRETRLLEEVPVDAGFCTGASGGSRVADVQLRGRWQFQPNVANVSHLALLSDYAHPTIAAKRRRVR
ncbi:MAG: hypothetical protein AABY89_05290, partial [Acidobacteriota bacterium]